MKKISRFRVLLPFVLTIFFLPACGGTLPKTTTSMKEPDEEASALVFTGDVQAIDGAEWMISGQKIFLDPQVLLEPNIAIGDRVTVDANVFADRVVATKVELSAPNDIVFDVISEVTGVRNLLKTPSPDLRSVPAGINNSSNADSSRNKHPNKE